MPTASKQKARPVHELRFGRIRASVWENETEGGTRHNVTVSRLWIDDEGQWHDSSSFGRDDLLLVAKVVDQAHTWICEQSGSSSTEDAA